MNITPKIMFLVDGIGALISASIMGFIIAGYEPFFGMPKDAAYFLAAIPVLFMVYSLYNYCRFPSNWKPYLRLIAIANLCYCFLSIAVVFYHFQELTNYGLAYFLAEIVVVLSVVVVELQVLKKDKV